MGTTKQLQQPIPGNSLERAAYTLAEFCYRNQISRPAYHKLRAEGREQQATARAMTAGNAAVKSSKHVSKQGRRGPRVRAKRRPIEEAPS